QNEEHGPRARGDLLAKQLGGNLKVSLSRVRLRMILFHRRVHGAQFDASLLERCSRSETREKFRHAMGTLGDHRGRKMMRAADDIRDDFGLLWIWDARLKHADDSGGTLAKLNGLANHRRISLECFRPETIGKDKDTGGLRAVIFRAYESPEDRMQTHHVEIAP